MGRPAVPVDEARALYGRLGSWVKVSNELRRPDGTTFKAESIAKAVREAGDDSVAGGIRANQDAEPLG